MSLLEELNDDAVWDSFLKYKLEKHHLSQKEQEIWQTFIEKRQYRSITEHLTKAGFSFDYPTKISVNKSGTGKKRIVYSYGEIESMVLKAMAFLLYRYDDKISSSCYSFRRNSSAKEAIGKVLSTPHLNEKFCLKADIRNYFNSIPPDKLLTVLREVITDDEPLLLFLERLLLADKAYENGVLITENRGAMAGTPISPFFANIYLLSLDRLFESREIPYFRYSDDILIFADSKKELEDYQKLLQSHIAEKGLTLNPDKVHISTPGKPWEFLGFCYRQGTVDLSDITKEKMKAKIKRKAHSLYRWRTRKHADFDRTAKAMIRTFNKKFYDEQEENSFTWSRWFFPVLNTTDGLKELDTYLIQYIRYLYSGRHYKGNYRVTYEHIKELGFRSLVHEYYLFKEGCH
ncbi:MAG: reverse transcriptase domain-containing protein [Lachnospiraceae bacterium]